MELVGIIARVLGVCGRLILRISRKDSRLRGI